MDRVGPNPDPLSVLRGLLLPVQIVLLALSYNLTPTLIIVFGFKKIHLAKEISLCLGSRMHTMTGPCTHVQ